jgi:hypothetical protein
MPTCTHINMHDQTQTHTIGTHTRTHTLCTTTSHCKLGDFNSSNPQLSVEIVVTNASHGISAPHIFRITYERNKQCVYPWKIRLRIHACPRNIFTHKHTHTDQNIHYYTHQVFGTCRTVVPRRDRRRCCRDNSADGMLSSTQTSNAPPAL